jgi:hypothetical protein
MVEELGCTLALACEHLHTPVLCILAGGGLSQSKT